MNHKRSVKTSSATESTEPTEGKKPFKGETAAVDHTLVLSFIFKFLPF